MTVDDNVIPFTQTPQTGDDSWKPTNLNRLPAAPPVKPDLAGTGLIYPGKRHVFSGLPESAKTLLAYCILIQNAGNGNTGILIDFEMGPYDARQRLQELGATEDEIDRILYIEPDQPATPDRIQALIDHKPTAVVIDAAAGAYQLQGLDDEKRQQVEKFSGLYVRGFWKAGISTILIDHVTKDAETRGRFAIGSERKLGGADVHFGFDTVKAISRGTSGHYKIIVHKDRGGYHKRGHLADVHLESDPDTHQIEWRVTEPANTTDDEGHFRPTALMEKASRYLEARTPDEEVTRNTIYIDALGGKGSARTAAIDALVRDGYITETPGSNRARLLKSIKPYRQEDESANEQNSSTMRVAPLTLFSSKTTEGESAKTAYLSRGAVVPSGATGGASTTEQSGGAVVRVPTAPPPPAPPSSRDTTDPEWCTTEHGWFNSDGNLTDPYLDSIAPDPEPTTNEPDWPTP